MPALFFEGWHTELESSINVVVAFCNCKLQHIVYEA
jgi:hypothetical protein